ncbi:MAG: hypothetical protein RIS64_1869 [Bacteroidota bacterium]|jgi:hypothetical protein
MKNFFFRLVGASAILTTVTTTLTGQCHDKIDPLGRPCRNVIQTAVPFMRIAPDARSGAMGDVGIATSPDANAMHFNASKLVFAEQSTGASVTYTPWLRNLGVDDIYLADFAGFYQFGEGKRKQAVGIDLRYFSLGKIDWTDENGTRLSEGVPREFSAAVGYSRQLTDKLSVGLTGKFIYSNLAAGLSIGSQQIGSGKAGAADVSLTYKTPIKMSDKKTNLMLGLAVSNIGSKVTYVKNGDFLPTNMGLGAAWEIPLDQYNTITFALDVNKLLVPTPDSLGEWRTLGSVAGIFRSFADSKSNFGEKMRELYWSTGVEYWYDKQFAVRAGYFYEHSTKGGRQYFTAGLGLKYNVFGINLSYLVPTTSQRNPLDNTLRFSLLFDLGSFKGETVNE